jgi:hypothetical protein
MFCGPLRGGVYWKGDKLSGKNGVNRFGREFGDLRDRDMRKLCG